LLLTCPLSKGYLLQRHPTCLNSEK
jgi:hypothetical protein